MRRYVLTVVGVAAAAATLTICLVLLLAPETLVSHGVTRVTLLAALVTAVALGLRLLLRRLVGPRQ